MTKLSVNQKLELILNLIERFKGGAHKRMDWREIRTILDVHTEKHAFIAYPIERHHRFFRGRKLTSDTPWNNTKDLVAPPHELIKDFGRCNIPGRSVFYASNNLETVFSELDAHIGDKIQIIEVIPKKDKIFLVTGIGDIDRVRRFNHSIYGGEKSAQHIRDYWKTLNTIEKLRINVLDAFLSEFFSRRVNEISDYKITSAFSDVIFSQPFSGFLYPSIAHLGGINLAINKEDFDKNFLVEKSLIYEITDVLGYGVYGNINLATSQPINENGDIIWKERLITETKFSGLDELVRHLLISKKNGYLLLLFMKTDTHKENQTVEGLKTLGPAQAFKSQFLFDAYRPLAWEASWEELKIFADNHNDNWNVVFVKLAEGIDRSEDADKQAKEFHTCLDSGNTNFWTFGKNGEGINICSITPRSEENYD